MVRPGRTQKQIAERYKGDVGYYNRLHPWRSARLIVSLVALFGGLIAILIFHKRAPDKFFNPGPLSVHHAKLPNNCDDCHDKSLITGGHLTAQQFKEIVGASFREGAAAMRVQQIDLKCERCHLARDGRVRNFHEPNVVENRSCSACHQEHQGPGPMAAVVSFQCGSCHNDPAIMRASAQKPVPAGWTPLLRHPQPPQKVVFNLARPEQGYTETFSSFWQDHPEFRINLAKAADPRVRDPDTLRFNHQRHFNADIPAVDGSGRKLDCNFCHQPETEGRFMKRISYEANCQPCHSLQFDSRNPDLKIPHGNATAVLGFLRSLPTQYEDLARKRGITTDIRSFVEEQRRQLRAQFHSDDELIRSVFFTADPYKPQALAPAPQRAQFAGCAYCHEVKPSSVGAPTITPPVLVDRWMLLSDFNHAKHSAVKCETCHTHARNSTQTPDILLPVKASCVTCHSPQGKVAAECITCHRYHAPSGSQSLAAGPDSTRLSANRILPNESRP